MNNPKEENLYFIALIPPEPYFSEGSQLKELMATKFDSKAALKSPPHITLHMPFKLKNSKLENLNQLLISMAEGNNSIQIEQNGFGTFAPRVIYINVDKTDALAQFQKDLLKQLRRHMKLDSSDYKNQGFHPHMTIGFRDLKKSRFEEAWQYFEPQEILWDWSANEISLLKHDGKHWEVFKTYAFA